MTEQTTTETGIEVDFTSSPTLVSKDTVIHPHLMLSDNMNLANFTTGMSNGMNVFTPIMTSHLIDPRQEIVANLRDQGVKSLVQHHKIARNLQHMAETVIEPLISAFEDDLNIYTAYLNPANMPFVPAKGSKHFTGEAVNLFLRSEQDNMFLKAEEVLDKLKGYYTHAVLNFNGISWLHLLLNGPYSYQKFDAKNPVIKTIDHQLGQQAAGLFPFRGMYKNAWSQTPFAPMRALRPK